MKESTSRYFSFLTLQVHCKLKTGKSFSRLHFNCKPHVYKSSFRLSEWLNFGLSTGKAEHTCFPAAVPLWRILLLHPTEGAGGSQHCLDRRVCHTEAEVQDTPLHTHLPGHKLTEQWREIKTRIQHTVHGIQKCNKCTSSNSIKYLLASLWSKLLL